MGSNFPRAIISSLAFNSFFLSEDILSVNKIPFRWSYSCWITLAIIPEHVIFFKLNFSSTNSIVNFFFLITSSDISGILRHPSENLKSYKELIKFVEDRPGHDFRYAIDYSKLKNELSWQPKESFNSGLRKTFDWYLKNLDWIKNITRDKYNLSILGL